VFSLQKQIRRMLYLCKTGKKEEQIEVRECLLSLGAETFVFQFAKDQDI
jgi:hypothetical protein